MKYILLISILINIVLLIKISVMKLSIKALAQDFEERASLDSDTLLGVSSRDRSITYLASALNETLSKLRTMYHSYKQGDEGLKNAITNVVHDIRTPLTAICGYLELTERYDKSPELAKYLEVISERTNYMKGLTEELFEYLLVRDVEAPSDKQEVNINRMLEDCIMNMYPTLMEKGIKLKVELTEKRIVRNLYPEYLERVFNNLISNALKYSNEDLGINLEDDGTIIFSNKANNLTSVQVEKLFDRFYTVETGQNSTGIGLSIVRSFIEKMDGTIGAEYKEGRLLIKVAFPIDDN